MSALSEVSLSETEAEPLIVPATEADLQDLELMRQALVEARHAQELGEVPVGCVIAFEGSVIARAHNLREQTQDPTAHAEMLAIRQAASHLGSWRLAGATAYVTLEPCPMCAGALVNARVERVVYGADDPKAGATTTLYNIGRDLRLNHRFVLSRGILGQECGSILSEFFAQIRANRRARDSAPEEHAPERSGATKRE